MTIRLDKEPSKITINGKQLIKGTDYVIISLNFYLLFEGCELDFIN
jgi:hypothetical protein